MRALAWLACSLLTACNATVIEDGSEPTGRIEQSVWSHEDAAREDAHARVCIPMGEGCLRIVLPINTSDRIDGDARGELLAHGCVGDEPVAEMETFHGSAFTGHGTLWLDGATDLSDGSSLELDVVAELGDCP